jgi:hypothetical protein
MLRGLFDAAAKAPPVPLPRAMPLAARHLHPSGGSSGKRYDLEIGAARGCGGANACFMAAFTAAPGRTVFGRRVVVTGATRAGYTPLSCGASCSPPQIAFIVHGIRYTIQANLKKTARGDRAILIRAAESAISAAPR